MTPIRLLLSGTGSFAARILFDLAATSAQEVHVEVLGRNAMALEWLRTAARSRASMFGRRVHVSITQTDYSASDLEEKIAAAAPQVVVQAASAQGAAVIGQAESRWSRLVREGGYSASAVLQADVSLRVAGALKRTGLPAHFVNCSFPDVVNELILGSGLPVTCGVGNISILEHAFKGALPAARDLKLLSHYQNVAAWRLPPQHRSGEAPRVWISGREIDDVFERFASVQLTAQPVVDISGASAVPVILALAGAGTLHAHAAGALGLPGGYPVRIEAGVLTLDLPSGLGEAEAVRWNRAHEERSGLIVTGGGRVEFTGRLRECLAAESFDLSGGFALADLEPALHAFAELRRRLTAS